MFLDIVIPAHDERSAHRADVARLPQWFPQDDVRFHIALDGVRGHHGRHRPAMPKSMVVSCCTNSPRSAREAS